MLRSLRSLAIKLKNGKNGSKTAVLNIELKQNKSNEFELDSKEATDIELSKTKKTSKNVNFCSNFTSFLANKEEFETAKKKFKNDELKRNDLLYLKELEKQHQRYSGLFDAVHKLIDKYWNDIFAETNYSRRTYNVKARKLGIKEKYRDKIFYVKQYPLNQEKRAAIMEYTYFNKI